MFLRFVASMIHRPGAPSFRTTPGCGACDFLNQYTAFFAVVYVSDVMEVGSRRIVHDRDRIFGQFGRPATIEESSRGGEVQLDRVP